MMNNSSSTHCDINYVEQLTNSQSYNSGRLGVEGLLRAPFTLSSQSTTLSSFISVSSCDEVGMASRAMAS